jgi:hypothetical protein
MDQRNAALASFAKDNPEVALTATVILGGGATAGAFAPEIGAFVVGNAGALTEATAVGAGAATLAGAGFGQASKFIQATTAGFAKTGGRSGRTTFQSFGSGGQKGAEKLFNSLTKGKSEGLENGGRLGNLGDGAKVQISAQNGVTSVRITQQTVTTGSRIPKTETIKVRFKDE